MGLVPDGGYLATVIHLEPSVENVGIFQNDVAWWIFMRVQWRGRLRSNGTSAKMARALHDLCMGTFVCAAVSKGKCQRRCQGWMIAVVFSALLGRVRRMWWMVNSLTPFFSPASGDLSWDRQWRGRGAAGWLGGWACLAPKQTLSAL